MLTREMDMLGIFRGDIAQYYRITRATWGFSTPVPYSVPVFCLAIETEPQYSSFPDDILLPHAPSWRIDIWARGLHENMLLPGNPLPILPAYDDATGVISTAFYYDTLEGTVENVVRIAKREDNFLEVAMEGYVQGTGSMPPTRITVDARFMRLTPRREINFQVDNWTETRAPRAAFA